MEHRITLSVLLLRKHSELFKDHENNPAKRFLGNMLYQSTRRTLTANEAERAIEGINKLRGVK